jgi:lipopolysaccharide/colanic/teichoic acid biosynthesis glycosyltransferase
VSEVLPAKLAIELQYMNQRNVWTDLGTIVKTIVMVGR